MPLRRIARPGRPKSTYVCIHGRAGETNKLQENEKYLETGGLPGPPWFGAGDTPL
jgi:hypothetical protein